MTFLLFYIIFCTLSLVLNLFVYTKYEDVYLADLVVTVVTTLFSGPIPAIILIVVYEDNRIIFKKRV